MKSIFIFLFAFFSLHWLATAQSVQVIATGTVMDKTQAVVPGASITAYRGGRVVASSSCDSSGQYRLALPPGLVTLTASSPRFRPVSKSVDLKPGVEEQNFSLSLPEVEETVTIAEDGSKVSLEQVPGNTALVSQKEITQSIGITLKDVLAFVPGVMVQPRFGADESQFSIRGSGLRSNFHERGVNLFINGEPYQDADGFSDFEALELQSVREVEVWKGANALRYGGNTSGGAVNFMTYTGDNAAPFHVSVEGGSFGLFKGLVSSGGRHGKLTYYSSLSDTELEGYREHSKQGRQRFYGNLGRDLSENTKARLSVIYVNAAEQLPGALTRDEFFTQPKAADPNTVTNNWGRFQNAVHVGLDVTHQISNYQELEVVAYGRYRELWHPIYQILDQDTRTFGGEVRYRYFGSLFGKGDRLVFAVAPQTGTQGDRNWENILGRRGPLAAQFGARANNWDVYFENQMDLSRSLTFTFGGRGDVAYRGYTDLFLADGNQSDSRTYRSFSPKVGLTWRVTEEVQVFGNVSRSYEPPLLFELTSYGGRGFLPLRAQDTWQYEVGSRGQISHRFNWDVAFFDLEVKDELLNENVTPFPGAHFTIPTYRNVPGTRHLGVETGIGATLKQGVLTGKDRLSFRVAHTYADYTFTKDPSFTGHWLPGQPRHLLRSELRYEHPGGGVGCAQLGLVSAALLRG